MSRYLVVPIFFLLAATGSGLAQTETALAAEDTTLASQYFAQAEKLAKATKYDSSNYYYQLAATIYEKMARQSNSPRLWERYVECYNNIGDNFYLNGQFDKSLEVLDKALESGLKIFGENHASVARNYHRMGNAHKGRGDRYKAREYTHKALAIRLDVLEENHPDVARSYGNLANSYADDGDVDTAVLYCEKILAIFRQAYGENHPDVAKVYENLGVFYGSRYAEKSFECHNQALAIRRMVFGENHPALAGSYSNLANFYLQKHDYDKALEHHDKVMQILRQRFGENSLQVASVYRNFGVVYYNKRDYRQALEYFNKDLAIELQLLNARHPSLASIYQKFGKLYDATNQYEKALQYYQKSLLCLVPDFADSNFSNNPSLGQLRPDDGVLLSLKFKAEALQGWSRQNENDLKKLQAALSAFALVIDYIAKMRSGYKAEGSKLALQEKIYIIYEKVIQASLQAYGLTKNAAYKEQAFRFAERGKAVVLAQLLQESQARQFTGIPASWLEKERALKIDLAFSETEIEKEKRKNEKQDKTKLRRHQDRYFALKKDYDELMKRFEKSYPKYYGLKYKTSTAAVAELQKSLDDQTAVLEYFVGDSAIFAFAVTKQGFEVVATKRDSSFAGMVAGLANSFKNVTSKPAYLQRAAQLYQILVKPLEAHIANKPQWIIIPDGELHQIPFEALLSKNVSPAIEPDDRALPYLIQQHEISYHYSATLLLQSYQAQKTVSHTNLFAGFAPVFSQERKNGNLVTTDFSPAGVARPDAHSYLMTRDGKTLDELKYSEQELRDIMAAFLYRGRAYLHQDASEENFKTNLKGYKFVHVATHGVISSDNPKLSNLAFSQPQDRSAREDGILYSAETYNLDLNADLLVLSACQTGAGKFAKGEGLMALTRGFLYSGARNIVASLWKVYDQHTSLLMVEMYRQIAAGKSYSAALREAKLKMITNPETAGPQSWAGFVLIGR